MNAYQKPNIVFILADDMGYGDFGAFNGGLSKTPALDNLAGQGLCLTQQYTASPVCNPSRACLLTGRYPHRTGSIDTLEWRGLERLALREVTIADVLQGAGYATGLVGKWHLGAFDPRYHPMRRGFDETVCFRGGMHDYWNWRLEYNEEVRRADGRYLTDVFTEEACSFIERHRAEPFFLHLAYNAPHGPLQAPADEVRPFAQSGQFTSALCTLYGMIARMDAGIARVLETLRRLGLEENTVVCFTSDNGPQFGGQGEECITRFNCGLHGAKGEVYEGGIRVPMLLRWPGGLPRACETHAMAHFADWFSTLLALADVPVPAELKLDGVNVLPLLRGEKGKVDTRRFWQWNRYTPRIETNAAMRDGDWKLVRPAMPGTGDITEDDVRWLHTSMYEPEYFESHGLVNEPFPSPPAASAPPAELYNIADDPLELHDLAGAQPARVHRMSIELENWFEAVEAERGTIASC